MRFDSYHPMINLIYFVAAVAATICFNHPVFLCIAYLAAFLYSVRLNGMHQFLLNVCLLPLAFLYGVYYAYFNHFGENVLWHNFIDNEITFEALVYGVVNGMIWATVFMWCGCIFAVVSADKVMYLSGRISPKFSLFLSILLRSIPRIRIRAGKIALARRGVGKSCSQGSLFARLKNGFSMVSVLVTWTLEDFIESAASMKSRGYTLKGRSAFSVYRFDNRDRAVVIVFFACLTALLMAVLFDQTNIYYNPVIVMHKITPVSVFFYLIYGFFLFLPMVLQGISEWRFQRQCL